MLKSRLRITPSTIRWVPDSLTQERRGALPDWPNLKTPISREKAAVLLSIFALSGNEGNLLRSSMRT